VVAVEKMLLVKAETRVVHPSIIAVNNLLTPPESVSQVSEKAALKRAKRGQKEWRKGRL
jgi:hypothetical protein